MGVHRFIDPMDSWTHGLMDPRHHTFNTSSSRATSTYSTGARKIDRTSREMSPPTITIAKGFWESLPMPVDMAAGSRPMHATSAVIMMGRRRSSDASNVAVAMVLPSSRSLLTNEYRMTLVWTATPINATKPKPDDTLKCVPVSFKASSPPTGTVTSTLNMMMAGNLRFPYSANRIIRISTMVMGMITIIWDLAARYSLYSPPQSKV